MNEKLKKYFERMTPIITCPASLNPCFNVHGVEFLIESINTDLELFDDSYATKAKKWFIDYLEGLYNIYYTKYGNPTTTESSSGGEASSSRASGGNQMTRLLNRLKEHKNKKAMSDPSLSSEYERYVHSDFVTHLQTTEFATFDVLGFWKAKETMFPKGRGREKGEGGKTREQSVSVQATSVASESAFLTSGRELSIRRTRLTPASLELCMCLKDHLDSQEHKQDKSTLETPVDIEEEILDAEVQENEAIPLSDEEIALDAASSEGSMSGPGSGGEEAVDYGYDVYHDASKKNYLENAMKWDAIDNKKYGKVDSLKESNARVQWTKDDQAYSLIQENQIECFLDALPRWDRQGFLVRVEKVKALGANGDMSGSRVGVVWIEVGGGIVRARVVSRVVLGLLMKVMLLVLRGWEVFVRWFWIGELSLEKMSMKSVRGIFFGGFWVEELALEAMKYDDQGMGYEEGCLQVL
ncbi:zinc finger BED domain-containing protein RICESLEEPER 2-like protein [Tanacetum coccineum]|uniref:Zinc finger BED domain-containing protein RICESLEEPER 2-like protein n=1 Tax=Tanacetum coccineum TaxID=301880 RepID=A0ABQ5EBF9_9ASTR